MRVKPNAEDLLVADSIHERFSSLPGSDHIATRLALAHLAAVLRTNEINSVIEFGAGIGTITYLLLTYPARGRTVVTTEHNQFCLEQLARNIPADLQPQLTVISNGEPPEGQFDLVVIDGKALRSETNPFLRAGVICFIEGGRRKQRTLLVERAKERGLKCRLNYYGQRHLPQFRWKTVKFRLPTFNFPPLRTLLTLKRGCAIAVCSKGSSEHGRL